METTGSFIATLDAAREKMRPSERKLADIVLADPQAAIEMTMEAIAQRAGVSAPTVARFCAAAGCDGFRDFTLKLARDQGHGLRFAHPDVDSDDSPATIVQKIFSGVRLALQAVAAELKTEALEQALDILANAARIEFYGSGNSGIVAQDIQHKFFRLGAPTMAYTDPHVFCMSALTLGPGDAVIVISSSGRTSDILEAARNAIASGARVVAITRDGSPLAAIASVALGANVAEDNDLYAPMTSRLAHLVIGDVLTVALAQRKGDLARLRLQRAKTAVRHRRPKEAF